MLNVPQNGIENKPLIFIKDPSAQVTTETWFDFDRLLFDTNAATLQPSSQEQLQNIANILKACNLGWPKGVRLSRRTPFP